MKTLIALDIDGTLYNDQKEIMPRTRAALIQAQEAGAVLVLASGRPVAGLKGIARQLEMEKHHGLLLGYNGGMVTDYETGEVIYDNTIPLTLANELLFHLEGYPVIPVVDDGTYIYTDKPDNEVIVYESSSNSLKVKEVESVRKAVDFAPAKVLIFAPEERLKECTPGITAPYEQELSFIMSAPFYLEATPRGVDKAGSMKKVCEKLGVTKDHVIAFGDAQNDISMVSFAGTGIAMGNACSELKDVADIVTLSNNEDGIVSALDSLREQGILL